MSNERGALFGGLVPGQYLGVDVTSFREDCGHAELPETSSAELVVASMVRLHAPNIGEILS